MHALWIIAELDNVDTIARLYELCVMAKPQSLWKPLIITTIKYTKETVSRMLQSIKTPPEQRNYMDTLLNRRELINYCYYYYLNYNQCPTQSVMLRNLQCSSDDLDHPMSALQHWNRIRTLSKQH